MVHIACMYGRQQIQCPLSLMEVCVHTIENSSHFNMRMGEYMTVCMHHTVKLYTNKWQATNLYIHSPRFYICCLGQLLCVSLCIQHAKEGRLSNLFIAFLY